jgi:GTP cyclohydrolase I
VVGYCAARLQLQERLASDIVKMLTDALDGKVLGMALVMRGKHLCKTMRGVRNNGNMTVAHLEGMFKENQDCRREFYKLIDLQENNV